MKRIVLFLFLATATCSPALAIPNLQLYSPAEGVYYDFETESWIIPHVQYDLWVIGAQKEVKDVKIAFSVPNDEDGRIVIKRGSSSLTLDEETMTITYEQSRQVSFYNGQAPFFVENGIPLMGDGQPVPGGGVFPSSYYQYYVGNLGLNEVVTNYSPEDPGPATALGDIEVLSISVEGYSWASMIAYDHVVLGKNHAKYVKTPYSHDGSSTTPVPEPGTLLLLGSGILGIAGNWRRRKTASH